jgi:hypothetical protein
MIPIHEMLDLVPEWLVLKEKAHELQVCIELGKSYPIQLGRLFYAFIQGGLRWLGVADGRPDLVLQRVELMFEALNSGELGNETCPSVSEIHPNLYFPLS